MLPQKKGFSKRSKLPVNYSIVLQMSLKRKGLIRLRNSGKTWDYWKRPSPIEERMPRINSSVRWTLTPGRGRRTSTTWPGYKAHIVMEEETGIITGVETTPANATDGSQLKPMLKEQEEVHSIKPKELTGDKAYDWGENLESLDSNQTIANISLSKQVNHRNGVGYFTVDDFLYDYENIKLMCPAGHISTNLLQRSPL